MATIPSDLAIRIDASSERATEFDQIHQHFIAVGVKGVAMASFMAPQMLFAALTQMNYAIQEQQNIIVELLKLEQ